jgi:hypothetical protein
MQKQPNTISTNKRYFVSSRVCCVNQYDYESRYRPVVMPLIHTTDETCYKVLYQHTVTAYLTPITQNFKQQTRTESKKDKKKFESENECFSNVSFIVRNMLNN